MRFTNIVLGFEGKDRLNTLNYEGWNNGATKLGWAVQMEQLAAVARWVFGLGMRQLMAAWVLGSKMGFSRVGMSSIIMVWAATSSRRHDMMGLSLFLSCSRLSLSFLFFLFFYFFIRFWLFRLVLGSY